MLSRKKTRTELSKPGEVQGKYVKKETSPLLRSECRGRAWLGRGRVGRTSPRPGGGVAVSFVCYDGGPVGPGGPALLWGEGVPS